MAVPSSVLPSVRFCIGLQAPALPDPTAPTHGLPLREDRGAGCKATWEGEQGRGRPQTRPYCLTSSEPTMHVMKQKKLLTICTRLLDHLPEMGAPL